MVFLWSYWACIKRLLLFLADSASSSSKNLCFGPFLRYQASPRFSPLPKVKITVPVDNSSSFPTAEPSPQPPSMPTHPSSVPTPDRPPSPLPDNSPPLVSSVPHLFSNPPCPLPTCRPTPLTPFHPTPLFPTSPLRLPPLTKPCLQLQLFARNGRKLPGLALYPRRI